MVIRAGNKTEEIAALKAELIDRGVDLTNGDVTGSLREGRSNEMLDQLSAVAGNDGQLTGTSEMSQAIDILLKHTGAAADYLEKYPGVKDLQEGQRPENWKYAALMESADGRKALIDLLGLNPNFGTNLTSGWELTSRIGLTEARTQLQHNMFDQVQRQNRLGRGSIRAGKKSSAETTAELTARNAAPEAGGRISGRRFIEIRKAQLEFVQRALQTSNSPLLKEFKSLLVAREALSELKSEYKKSGEKIEEYPEIIKQLGLPADADFKGADQPRVRELSTEMELIHFEQGLSSRFTALVQSDAFKQRAEVFQHEFVADNADIQKDISELKGHLLRHRCPKMTTDFVEQLGVLEQLDPKVAREVRDTVLERIAQAQSPKETIQLHIEASVQMMTALAQGTSQESEIQEVCEVIRASWEEAKKQETELRQTVGSIKPATSPQSHGAQAGIHHQQLGLQQPGRAQKEEGSQVGALTLQAKRLEESFVARLAQNLKAIESNNKVAQSLQKLNPGAIGRRGNQAAIAANKHADSLASRISGLEDRLVDLVSDAVDGRLDSSIAATEGVIKANPRGVEALRKGFRGALTALSVQAAFDSEDSFEVMVNTVGALDHGVHALVDVSKLSEATVVGRATLQLSGALGHAAGWGTAAFDTYAAYGKFAEEDVGGGIGRSMQAVGGGLLVYPYVGWVSGCVLLVGGLAVESVAGDEEGEALLKSTMKKELWTYANADQEPYSEGFFQGMKDIVGTSSAEEHLKVSDWREASREARCVAAERSFDSTVQDRAEIETILNHLRSRGGRNEVLRNSIKHLMDEIVTRGWGVGGDDEFREIEAKAQEIIEARQNGEYYPHSGTFASEKGVWASSDAVYALERAQYQMRALLEMARACRDNPDAFVWAKGDKLVHAE